MENELPALSVTGLKLVPYVIKEPLKKTTYSVGVGCCDLGTSDGGSGMIQALGVQLKNNS